MLRRIGMPIRLPLMTALTHLIRHGILRRAEPGAHAHVAVLRDGLVRFFGGGGPTSLAFVFDGFHGVSVVEWAVSAAWMQSGRWGEREEWGKYLLDGVHCEGEVA